MRDRTTDLGEHEAWYLDEVTFHLRRVPSDARTSLLAVLHDNLSERPPSASRPDLLDALGLPADYAERLRVAGGFHDLPARRPRSTSGRLALLLAVALVIGGAWLGWSWWTDDVELSNGCTGVWGTDSGVVVEQKEAAGFTESVVSYVDGAQVGLGMCLSADAQVQLRDVRLEVPMYTLFRPTGLTMRTHAEPMEDERPFQPFVLTEGGDDGMLFVTVVGKLEGCEHYGEGGGISFDHVSVIYRHHGRERSATVPLETRYTFESPPADQCPRPRDFDEG